jgi:hypothetical protein
MRHANSKQWDKQEATLRTRHDARQAPVRYALGVEHCANGNQPTCKNGDYLRGYADQYATEQSATNLSEQQEQK